MQKSDSQRSKLSRFVDLARVYRGWSRTELSRVLGRDPSKIIPESGNPKLDLLVGLAEALDWTIGDVAESVWCDRNAPESNETRQFRDLSVEALAAHESGRYEDMLGVTRRMRLAASTPREHAITCNREVGAWDGLGRYPRALEASQEGLSIGCPDPDVQAMLQANLANAHYTLWHLIEAKAVARDLIERLEADPTRSEPCEWRSAWRTMSEVMSPDVNWTANRRGKADSPTKPESICVAPSRSTLISTPNSPMPAIRASRTPPRADFWRSMLRLDEPTR